MRKRNRKCKICKEGCENTLMECNHKCPQCMKQSKVAEVKKLADTIPDQYLGVKKYVTCRLVPQMIYYGTESLKSKRKYMRWTTVSLVATGLIPILSMYASLKYMKIAIAALSSLVTFINAYLLTTNSKNTWILYRETRERLFNEFYKFYSATAPFVNNGVQIEEDTEDSTMESAERQEENKKDDMKPSTEKLAERMIDNCEKLMMKQMDNWLGQVMDDDNG